MARYRGRIGIHKLIGFNQESGLYEVTIAPRDTKGKIPTVSRKVKDVVGVASGQMVFPCSRALAILIKLGQDPECEISEWYSIEKYIESSKLDFQPPGYSDNWVGVPHV